MKKDFRIGIVTEWDYKVKEFEFDLAELMEKYNISRSCRVVFIEEEDEEDYNEDRKRGDW